MITIQQGRPGSVGHGWTVSVQGQDEPIVVEIHVAADILVGLEGGMEGQQPSGAGQGGREIERVSEPGCGHSRRRR